MFFILFSRWLGAPLTEFVYCITVRWTVVRTKHHFLPIMDYNFFAWCSHKVNSPVPAVQHKVEFFLDNNRTIQASVVKVRENNIKIKRPNLQPRRQCMVINSESENAIPNKKVGLKYIVCFALKKRIKPASGSCTSKFLSTAFCIDFSTVSQYSCATHPEHLLAIICYRHPCHSVPCYILLPTPGQMG